MEFLLKEERYHLPFLFLFSILLFLSFLGGRDLWAPVEPRYGEIARVMFSRGEWIVPTVNGDLYTDKPILYFWLVLIFSHLLGGVSEWALRLPSALSAIGLTLVTYHMGRDFFGPRVGFLASLVLSTASRVLWEGRWAHTDILFTLCFTSSVYLLLRRWYGRGGLWEALLAYALIGLATMTKGMIGFVLPGLIFMCQLIRSRDRQGWSRLKLIPGVLVFLLVTAPWFVAVSLQTQGAWMNEFVWTHHVQRYLSGVGHREPFYYYLINFPADFLPWTPFLIPAAIAAWIQRKVPFSPVPLSMAIWFFVVLIFFSLSDTKRGLYLFPLYAPVALWLAHALVEGEKEEKPVPWGFGLVTVSYAGLLVLTAISLPLVASRFQPDLLLGSLPVALVTFLGSLCAYLAFKKNHLCSGVFWIALMVLGCLLSTSLWIFPLVNRSKSPRFFAREIKQRVSPEDPLYIYADSMNRFNFYLQRDVIPILSKPEGLARLEKADGLRYLMIKEKDLRRIPAHSKLNWHLLAKRATGSKKWRLYRLGGQSSREETSVNPLPRTYVSGFGVLPFGKFHNIHPVK